MKSKKLILQINRMLVKRSKTSLEMAKKEILQEKRASEEINDAFKYYTKYWYDVVHPGLVSIACEAAGGKPEETIPLQVATLLLTAGFDIHDDIIDESKTKHGKPTVYAKFGKDITLLVGDAFLMKALVLLHKLERQFPAEKMDRIWDIINGLFFELGDAEALETSMKGNIDVSPEEAFQILKMKASTFEAHMRIGAIIGGGEKDIVDLLGEYGRTFGILVSIREEFIDVFEGEELQNRFRNEYLPLPVLYALRDKQTKRNIIEILSKERVTNKDAEKIVDTIYADKNVDVFRNEINQMVKIAIGSIKNITNKKVFHSMEILIGGMIEDI